MKKLLIILLVPLLLCGCSKKEVVKVEKISKKFKKIVSLAYNEEINIRKKDKQEVKRQAEELKEYLDRIIEACEE